MYKEVVINGDIYPEVQKVELPINQGGGTKASFVETSDSNASSTDIASGKTAYVNGTKITGAMPESSITNSGLLVSATPGNISNTNQNEITWNGVRGGLTTVMYTSYSGWYKVSDKYPTSTSQVIGGMAYLSGGSSGYSITSSNVSSGTGYIAVQHTSMWGQSAVFVSSANAVYLSCTFPETGTYLYSDGGLYISKITLNGTPNIYTNKEIVLADANLIASNIKEGVNILGVLGTLSPGTPVATGEISMYTTAPNNVSITHGLGSTPTKIIVVPKAGSGPMPTPNTLISAWYGIASANTSAVVVYNSSSAPSFGSSTNHSKGIYDITSTSFKFGSPDGSWKVGIYVAFFWIAI